MSNMDLLQLTVRVSTEEQTELSPASQLVEIRRWAAQHGYVVPEEYVFRYEGISGRKTAGRDGFRLMIATAKKKPKPFDAILLWKYSRFARNREDAILYKSMLRKQCGIDVLSISEPTADGAMGMITEALIEAMDEFYSLNLGQEVRRGMAEKHRRGEWQSTPPYGYEVKEHRLTPKEPDGTIARWYVFGWYGPRFAVSPVRNAKLCDYKRYYHMDDVGKTIFSTRKEASNA